MSTPPAAPAAPPTLRRLLGPARCLLAAVLPATPTPVLSLAVAAGLTSPDAPATARQLRATRAHLAELAQLGLAVVDEDGGWAATDRLRSPVPQRVAAVARRLDDVVRGRVEGERQEFRARLDPDRRRHRWHAARAAAVARAEKLARARQKGWWQGLSPEEQTVRAQGAASAFHALAPQDQAARKQALAQARHRVGESEPARYRAWLEGLSPTDLAARIDERARAFHARPAHEQRALVAAWDDHRARWDLPRNQRPAAPRRARAGDVPAEFVEESLLVRHSPTVEKLVLFDDAESGHTAAVVRSLRAATLAVRG